MRSCSGQDHAVLPQLPNGLNSLAQTLWIVHGNLITPHGIVEAAVRISHGRIAAITKRTPRASTTVNVRGAYLSPGFIDLHVWGPPEVISREAAKGGTTAFLTTFAPEPPDALLERLRSIHNLRSTICGTACLGVHLEGPFVNPARGGALPRHGMRRPTAGELTRLVRASHGRIRLVTIAPELPGAEAAIRWCCDRRITASLGHSEASAEIATRAVAAGASAVTHVFNGMPPFHHRRPTLLDVALMDERLTVMVILDGVHVSPSAFRLLVCAKGAHRVALVTDSIAHQGWDVVRRGGAYYRRDGTLAGSALRMIDAVRNAVEMGGVPLADAVRMASEVPARLLGDGSRGRLAVGARADLVAFNKRFEVLMTIVNGNVVYRRNRETS